MKKKLLMALCSCSCFCLEAKVDRLEYKELSEWRMTDHVEPFSKFFMLYKPKNIVELGLGFGTVNFIRNCDKVLSLELVVPRFGMKWFNECTQCYKDFDTWQGSTIDICENLVLLEGQRVSYLFENPSKIDFYLEEINNLSNLILGKGNMLLSEEIEVIFIDSGFICRADLVNAFFGKVPIIVAHDTNSTNGFYKGYGYSRITVPEDYERIHFSKGQGTTFFIRKDYQNLIHSLNEYKL
ncbi:MAG: hypothetical protein SP4CHLAM5_07220 [Chlamydiia bacterium]|nr:hypothetical protein [Chlamydiia bacterium]MCH9618589.1 hypothetical protein [Chlamydiia bacterium]MCH9623872.1 hypothetical protein [Chlamydiia bacterium]